MTPTLQYRIELKEADPDSRAAGLFVAAVSLWDEARDAYLHLGSCEDETKQGAERYARAGIERNAPQQMLWNHGRLPVAIEVLDYTNAA